MTKPWFAIIWFGVWGLFQAFAVVSVVAGKWKRPVAFPKEAYESLIYPDMAFIPIYLLASVLLISGHSLGNIIGLVAAGGVAYALIYLLALSRLKGVVNLAADGIFLGCTLFAAWQLSSRLLTQVAA
jgi:hypothetical protein